MKRFLMESLMSRCLCYLIFCIVGTVSALDPVIILIGPPGCGKGNLSEYFKEKYDYGYLGAGDLVRREVNQKSEIGIKISEITKSGQYINLDIMQNLMRKALTEMASLGKPFIIDGYGGNDPNMAQFLYDELEKRSLVKNTLVLFLDSADEVCKQRMVSRLQCEQCGKLYNSLSIVPQTAGKCDICPGKLISRSHETSELIEKRLSLYRGTAEPNFIKTVDLFPVLFYRTDGDLLSCSQFYQALLEKMVHFEGDATEFLIRNRDWIIEYQGKVSIPTSSELSYYDFGAVPVLMQCGLHGSYQNGENEFIHDAFTKARGEPVMLQIFCEKCDSWVMDYQKDGPGPLLRCYLDRIHRPSFFKQNGFDERSIGNASSLMCPNCHAVLGTPMIYKKEENVSKNRIEECRPAYLIVLDLTSLLPVIRYEEK